MPHDRPSISATVVDADAMLITDASAVTPVSVTATPMIAVRIGNPAATNAPNVMSRMTNATIRPTISGVSEIAVRQPGYTLPEYSTSTPASRAGTTASFTASRLLSLTSTGCPEYCTWLNATCWSGDTPLATKGSETETTCGTVFSLVIAASTPAL